MAKQLSYRSQAIARPYYMALAYLVFWRLIHITALACLTLRGKESIAQL